jgi:hypothetical protein
LSTRGLAIAGILLAIDGAAQVNAPAAYGPSGGAKAQPNGASTAQLIDGPAPMPSGIPHSHWNQAEMDIPISIAPHGIRPTSVQLLVSDDGGRNWRVSSAESAQAKFFRFVPEADGDYLFATRTFDQRGLGFPPGSPTPLLRVTVDRTQPELTLDATATIDGKVTVVYTIRDAAVEPVPPRLYYRRDLDSQWQEAKDAVHEALRQTAAGLPNDALVGQCTVRIPGEWRASLMRVQVRDRAGNESAATSEVERPRVATNPVARLASNGLPGDLSSELPIGTPFGSLAMPTDSADAQGLALESPQQWAPSDTEVPWVPPMPGTEPVRGSPQFDASNHTADDGSGRAGADPRPTSDALRPFDHTLLKPETPTPPPPGPAAGLAALPPGVTPRGSRSRSFSLEYDIDAAGSNGVAAIELWGTRDGGKTWQRWGSDPDRQSPFDIETSGEGLYGYRIVVVGGNGLASPRPLPGESADIYIIVDSQPPEVQLLAAEYGRGSHAGHLVLRWECRDPHLGARPIRLEFAASADGPWTTIAAGLENSGTYAWPANPQLPPRIFLRAVATDEAGNVAQSQLPSPVTVEGLAPRAKIRDLQIHDAPPAGN